MGWGECMLTSNEWHQRFLKLMAEPDMIQQCNAKFINYDVNGVFVPATVSLPVHNNCYAVSPLTLISGYGEDELPKLQNPVLRKLSFSLLKALTKPLEWAGLNQVQTLNNQCLSTNMYSSHWNTIDLSELRSNATTAYPDKALLLRSLNSVQHSSILQNARRDGWLAVATRQVYLHCDWKSFIPSTDIKRDRKLLEEKGWQFRLLKAQDECRQAKQLYDALYLDKYSQHNIQFSAEYMYHAVQHKLVTLFGLFYQDEMVATLGLVVIDGDMTCPIFGYDIKKPSKMGLYRRISIFTIEYARERNLNFNMSSGAPSFKANRRAKPEIEYSYVYTRHLNPYKRLVWRVLSFLTKTVYKPILQKYRL
ncbi:hypothetical protein TW74_04410 [Vibrio nigripulchritudo]|nr:hypothetical protein TW74_04410 [Vibrio nigripulchritudo]